MLELLDFMLVGQLQSVDAVERDGYPLPQNDTWVKRDTNTGRFIDQKADGTPFKGVRKEK